MMILFTVDKIKIYVYDATKRILSLDSTALSSLLKMWQ